MDLSTLIALGVPALIAALAYSVKKLSDAKLVREEATAKAKTARADAEKADADTTGRIVIGREADAEVIRNAFRELQARVDRCETRHEVQEKRHERDREEWRKAIEAKDAQIAALWREVRDLRTAIEGNR
jgi:hypothetical protein